MLISKEHKYSRLYMAMSSKYSYGREGRIGDDT